MKDREDWTNLENFVNLYDEVAQAMQRLKTFKKDPNDEDVNKDAREKAYEYTGRDIVTVDNQGREVSPAPKEVRKVLKTWKESALDTVLDFGAKNLEGILKDIEAEELPSVLVGAFPFEDGYADAAKLHQEYNDMQSLLGRYKGAKKSAQKVALLQEMKKKTPETLKAGINAKNEARKSEGAKNIISDKNIDKWAKTLAELGAVNPNFVEGSFKRSIAEKYDQLAKELGGESGVREYVIKSIAKLNEKYDYAKADEDREDKLAKEATTPHDRQLHSDKKDEYKAVRKQYEGMREQFYQGLYGIIRSRK